MNTVLALAGVVIKEMYRRKDFYVLFVLTAMITLLMGSMRFFDDDGIVRYLKEIFPLLAKPVGRGELIVGKFAGCWLACGLALLVFYFFFGVISASREHAWPL